MIILVSIVNQNENAEKLEVILDAARKRFGQFGLAKTTMSEIALEAGMSKAALYYYYPDKLTLFKAVIEREHRQFIEFINALLEKDTDPEAIFQQYNTLRLGLSQRMLTLARLETNSALATAKPIVIEIFKSLLSEEQKLITRIIEAGVRKKLFGAVNPDEMATLYIDGYRGLRTTMREKYPHFPSEEDYAEMEKTMSLFTQVFVNGLKK